MTPRRRQSPPDAKPTQAPYDRRSSTELERERFARAAAEHAARRIGVQLAVSEILGRAPGFKEAIPEILMVLGQQLGAQWTACFCFDAAAGALQCTATWAERPALGEFAAATSQAHFPDGVGIPGRAWAARAPFWIRNLQEDSNFPRRASARAAGLRSGVAFPILGSGESIGVIEVFFESEREDDDLLLQSMSSIGHHLGQFIERRRAERALRAREGTARLLAEVSDAFATALNLDDALARLRDVVIPRLADICVLDLVRADGLLDRVFSAHRDPERQPQLEELARRWPPHRDRSVGAAAAPRAGLHRFEFSRELFERAELDAEHVAAIKALEMRTAVSAPLIVRDECVGVLSLSRCGEGARVFTTHETELVAEIAHRAAIAVDRAAMFTATEQARIEAEEANRAKTNFLTMMSHELRTPLNAIAGYAELLELGVHGPITDAQRETLQRIQRSERHLLSLINDVLNFARIEAGRVEFEIAVIDAPQLFASIEPLVAPQLRDRNLAFHIACEPALRLRADGEKVRQILINLLSNAIKFTDRGGTIAMRGRTTDGLAEIEVQDDGVGVPPDKLERIFEPFVQLDRSLSNVREGAGLGLAISRDLARKMDGDISVRSTVGHGSVFTVKLPLA